MQRSDCWNEIWNDLFWFLNPILWIHVMFVQPWGNNFLEFSEMCHLTTGKLLCKFFSEGRNGLSFFSKPGHSIMLFKTQEEIAKGLKYFEAEFW